LTPLERQDLLATLEPMSVPSYLIDSNGTVRWLNAAGRRLFGDVRGRDFSAVVARAELPRARERFARQVNRARAEDFRIELLDKHGRRVLADVSSVPLLNDHRLVGLFGLLPRVVAERAGEARGLLTARQMEVLRLLAAGASTEEIQTALQISRETARNHIRHILRATKTHSRLEAVATARRLALLDD
jgi:PAS domain S-box-containing protein